MGIYERLGVRVFINASGTITRLGGSLMPREAVAAMAEASRSFVDLEELQEKVGRRIAELLGVEGAYVCAGAASGIVLATAACITSKDQEKVRRLPDTRGMKNEVIIHKAGGPSYIHQGIRCVGAKLVEVGTPNQVNLRDIKDAITENTAAIVLFLGFGNEPSLEEVVEVAKKAKVPIIVDAAAELPPVSNLTEPLKLGVDLIVFSGGKGLMGPQCTGLILGRKDLIEACALNGNPNSAIGRPMKVGKEEIVGLLTAIELFLEIGEEKMLREWERQAKYVAETLQGIPHVDARCLFPDPRARPSIVPRAYITFDGEFPMSSREVLEKLRNGHPSIEVRSIEKGIMVDPMTLADGEEWVVARRLREALTQQ